MNMFGLINTTLLFLLTIPIMLNHKLSPDGSHSSLYILIYIVINLFNIFISQKSKLNIGLKYINISISVLLSFAIIFYVYSTVLFTSITVRHFSAPVWEVHDIILQQEAAIRYLVKGKNPYSENYFNTPVADFDYREFGKPATNPALYHFVMPPFYLISSLPVYVLSNRLFGFFDARIMVYLAQIGVIFLIFKLIKKKELALFTSIIITFAPGIFDYLFEGRSDNQALFWLLLSTYLIKSRKLYLSSLVFAFAFLTKQTNWLFIPFWIYILLNTTKINFNKILLNIIIFSIGILIFTMPFIYLNAKSFFDSVIFYLSGNIKTGYPISGFGLGMLIYEFGFIKNIHEYYPFFIWQLIFGLTTLFAIFIKYKNKLNFGIIYMSYSIFLLSVWYTSRYFNNSHLLYISLVFLIGSLIYIDENRFYDKKI